MIYKIKYHRAADKELSKLDPKLQLEILDFIEELAKNPKQIGYKKLNNYKSERVPNKQCYKIKVAHVYRIIYTIEQDTITITIVKIKHRREVYK